MLALSSASTCMMASRFSATICRRVTLQCVEHNGIRSKAYPQLAWSPELLAGRRREFSFMYTGARKLNDIMKTELLEGKNAEEVVGRL